MRININIVLGGQRNELYFGELSRSGIATPAALVLSGPDATAVVHCVGLGGPPTRLQVK